MKPKINVENVCRAYNEARMQNSGRKNSPEKTIEILKSFGISFTLAKKMLGQSTLFQKSQRVGAGKGNHKQYVFSYTPIHVTWFQNWIYGSKKEETPKITIEKDKNFESECAAYLKQQGYQLKRCIGFDEDAFKKDYPQIWEKYLIYETV